LSFDDSRNVMTKNVQIPDSRIVWPPHYAPASSIVFAQNNIDIAATPERVWSLLIDCVQWPSWYKHCTDVSMLRGGPLLSAQSKFRFKTLGFYFEPDIETFEPFKTLIWSAKGPAGTRGAHAWYIERKTGGCRVITEEAQRGVLLAFIGGRTRRTLLTSHEEWLRALKVLAEKELGPHMPVESFTSTASSRHGVSDSPFKDEIARRALKHREDTPIVKRGPVGETGLAGPGA
jgi:hypothetical protein